MSSETNQHECLVMSEADIKKLVRNALMVAGQEMGADGDHWPVIKNTIKDIMSDWEDLDAARAAQAELKKQLYTQLAEIEDIVRTCSPAAQAEAAPRLAELREIYDAHFEEPAEHVIDLDAEEDDADKPMHIRRAEEIIMTMEDDNV